MAEHLMLIQYVLPNFANDGSDYSRQLQDWEAFVVKQTGGLTRVAVAAVGFWERPEDGVVVEDSLRIYQVAVERLEDVVVIDEKTLELFPDQHSFFVGDIGKAHISTREETRVAIIRFRERR